MCSTCGCGTGASGVRITDLDLDPDLDHGHVHQPGHIHDDLHHHAGGLRIVDLEERVLARNDEVAAANREWLAARGIVAVNLMSSPGSGKTTLLERTIRELGSAVAVVEGDQETVFDAARIRAAGCRVVQVNTGAGCHLDASMLADALPALDPPTDSILFIENVGNLVCPALFDLGESARVVVMSVTEGDDKPLKYPYMFRVADLVVINKIDLAPYVSFDRMTCRMTARSLNPSCKIIDLSATHGTGVDMWYAWLRHQRAEEDRVSATAQGG